MLKINQSILPTGRCWTPLGFGKYKGKTLPQVLFLDPDWFFWAYNAKAFCGQLQKEADELFEKATHIKIPKRRSHLWQVEYRVHPTIGKYCGFSLIRKSKPKHDGSTICLRIDHIDMSFPSKVGSYDKLGYRIFLRDLRFNEAVIKSV